MRTNGTAALGLTPNAAHEKPPTTPQSITEGNPPRKNTAWRPRWRSLRELQGGLLETFVNIGSPRP